MRKDDQRNDKQTRASLTMMIILLVTQWEDAGTYKEVKSRQELFLRGEKSN